MNNTSTIKNTVVKFFLWVGLIFSLIASRQVIAGSEKLAADLTGYDELVAVGDDIVLRAKLEKEKVFPFRQDIKGEVVEFWNGRDLIGKSTTDKHGMAKVSYTTPSKGNHLIKIVLTSDSEYIAENASSVISVIPRDKPVVITDLDHTIVDSSGFNTVIMPVPLIPVMKGAWKSIWKLKLKYFVVYLTAREDLMKEKTRSWLNFKRFPKGPVFLWDLSPASGYPYNHGKFKAKVVKELKKRFDNILMGFGDKPHDVAAYRQNELRSYYMGKPKEVIVPGAIKTSGWGQIMKHLRDNPLGTVDGDPILR
jgi:hypothetical protein